MPQTMPRKVAATARRTFLVSAPATAAITLGWGLRLWETRPHLTMMLFCIGLGASMVSAVVWALAVCHLAVARAFAAGVTVGQATQRPAPTPGLPASLRVVE